MKSNEITDKQRRVLPFLVTCKSIEEAARQADISPKQIYEYLKDPLFKAELELQRKSVVQEAIARLKANTIKAADTLADLLDSESDQIRRGAANDILTHTIKFMDSQEFEDRLLNFSVQDNFLKSNKKSSQM